jgi:hypothetical protein
MIRSAVLAAAAAMTAAIALAVPAGAVTGPPAGSRGTGVISVRTSKEKLCLTALGSGVVVAKPCVSRLSDEGDGQAWLLSRYDGFLAVRSVRESGECLGSRGGTASAVLVSCTASNEGGDALRYVELGDDACPGIAATSDCAEITLVNGRKLTAWVAARGHRDSYAVVTWDEDPGGMNVRFTWAVPGWHHD